MMFQAMQHAYISLTVGFYILLFATKVDCIIFPTEEN